MVVFNLMVVSLSFLELANESLIAKVVSISFNELMIFEISFLLDFSQNKLYKLGNSNFKLEEIEIPSLGKEKLKRPRAKKTRSTKVKLCKGLCMF